MILNDYLIRVIGLDAIPVTCIGEPIHVMMLACDCFDNFSDTYTTTRVKINLQYLRVVGSC